MFCILSWRIFWLTMLNRMAESARRSLAFTPLEIDILARLATDRQVARGLRSPTIRFYLRQLARLKGTLDRTCDPPPGNIVIGRGISRLSDIALSFRLGAQRVGHWKVYGALTEFPLIALFKFAEPLLRSKRPRPPHPAPSGDQGRGMVGITGGRMTMGGGIGCGIAIIMGCARDGC